jgi:hypothetical protein
MSSATWSRHLNSVPRFLIASDDGYGQAPCVLLEYGAKVNSALAHQDKGAGKRQSLMGFKGSPGYGVEGWLGGVLDHELT